MSVELFEEIPTDFARMRLLIEYYEVIMRLEGHRRSDNVDDRRGSGGNFGGGKGSIIGLIIVLVGAYYGVDLTGLVDAGGLNQPTESRQSSSEEIHLEDLSRTVLASTEDSWQGYFQKMGKRYANPTLVLYSGYTSTACGTGQAAMGPFYCPNDNQVYLDLSFYQEMKNKLGAAGDSAFAYVIAHEVGHHVQNLLGILPQVNRLRQKSDSKTANQLSVKLELQADCFAGVWARSAVKSGLFELGDEEKAFKAAEAVGDDRLQKRSQGYVVPDSFTHGTSAQRLSWFRKGLQSGDPARCDTFNND